MLDTVYTDNVTFEMIVPVEEVGSVEKKFMEASMGKAVLKKEKKLITLKLMVRSVTIYRRRMI